MIQKSYVLCGIFIWGVFLSCINPASTKVVNIPIVINEFMVDNCSATGILDSFGSSEDWVELYNNGNESVDLGDLYVADKRSDPKRYRLPDTLIEAGGYYILWGGNRNIGFSFSADSSKGEMILISNSDGVPVDSFAYSGVPEARMEGYSYGRYPDGSTIWQQQKKPTPGTANEG